MVSMSLPRANRVGFWRWDVKNFCYYTESGRLMEITENVCYYTPHPLTLNRAGLWKPRKISATTPPPPTESGRLLEITENSANTPPPVSCCAPPRLPAPDPPLHGHQILKLPWQEHLVFVLPLVSLL